MRVLALLCLVSVSVSVTVAAGPAAADEPFAHDESPYALRLDVDIATVALGAVLWGGTSFIGATTQPPFCGGSTTPACDASQVNAFDKLAIGHASQPARTAADIISFVPIAYLALDMVDVGPRHWKTYLTDLWVVAEALAWNGAVQDIVRRAVRRPRPFLYSRVYPSERDSPEAGFSFYSGHTSFAFALATSCAYTYTLRHPHSKWRFVVWPAFMAVASIEPILRVYSGDHFPTDVIVGAVAGSAIGLLFPALHRRPKSAPKVLTGMRLVPVVSQEQTVLSLVGRF